jgi:sec-independent protein translocase protein TatA
VLLVLGPKRLPEVGHSLGRGIRDFKHGISGHDDEAAAEAPEAVPAGATSAPARAGEEAGRTRP